MRSLRTLSAAVDPNWDPQPFRLYPAKDTPELMYHAMEEAVEVPADLVHCWKQLNKHPDWKAFVCPRCGTIYGGRMAGVEGSFRAHIREIEDTGGCLLNPARPGERGPANGKAKGPKGAVV